MLRQVRILKAQDVSFRVMLYVPVLEDSLQVPEAACFLVKILKFGPGIVPIELEKALLLSLREVLETRVGAKEQGVSACTAHHPRQTPA